MMDSSEPQRQLGKYTIQRELGRGGFATVYLAQDTVLRRAVALKVLHPVLLTDPAFVARFESEARAIAQFEHPRIAMIYELDHYAGRLCIAMQLMPGGSLADRILQHGRLAFAAVLRVVGDVAEALDHAHAAGFIHRDVKPSNILFNARGDAVLSDFGLVKAAEGSVIARTAMGSLLGTPPYMAPEVWEGQADSAQTDVYALGCVLYELLTGAVLFKGDTPPAVMLTHFQPRTYPAQWPGDTPPGIAQLLDRALAREPAARYASAGALAAELNMLGSSAPAALPIQATDAEAQADLSRKIGQWRETALAAERSGEIDAARVALQQWLRHEPEQPEAQEMLRRLDSSGSPATPTQPTLPADGGVQIPAAAAGIMRAPASGQTRRRISRAIVGLSAAWIIAWGASIWLAWFLEGGRGRVDAAVLGGWAGGWACAGLFAGLWLRRAIPIAQKWPTIVLAIGWPVCMTIATILAAIIYGTQPERGLDALALGAAVAAGIAGSALRGHDRAFTWGRSALLALGWAIGWRLAEVLNSDGSGGGPWHGVLYMFSLGHNFHKAFESFPQLVPASLLFGGLLGVVLGAGLVWLFGRRTAVS